MMSNLGTSQSNNNNTNTTNTPIRLSCGINPVTSSSSLFSSLDSTITELRSQLWNKDVYFARAHDLRSVDLVYGLAQCRNYLSAAQCVACFDAAVSAIKTCSSVTGAYVFLDNCFLRWVFTLSFIIYDLFRWSWNLIVVYAKKKIYNYIWLYSDFFKAICRYTCYLFLDHLSWIQDSPYMSLCIFLAEKLTRIYYM